MPWEHAQVLQVWWHGDDLHGLVEVLDTPAGRLVRGLYCQGFMFGASSRGWSCTVPQQDYSVIADDFQLFAYAQLALLTYCCCYCRP